MTNPEYILCRWRERFWPAKILCRSGGPRRTLPNWELGSLSVKILFVEEQINVKYADTKPLDKLQVENIVTKLESTGKKSDSAVEELKYRSALRVAMNILNQNTLPCANSSEQIVPAPYRDTQPNTVEKSQLCSHQSIPHDGELQESDAEEKKMEKRRSSRLAACHTENQAASSILVKGNVKTNRKLTQSVQYSKTCLPEVCISKHVHGKITPCRISAEQKGQAMPSSASVNKERRSGGKRRRECCNTAYSPERSLEYIGQTTTEEIMPHSELCYSATSTPIRKRSGTGRWPAEKLIDFLPKDSSELDCDFKSVNGIGAQPGKKDTAVVHESKTLESNWVQTEIGSVRLQDGKPERCPEFSASDYPESISTSSSFELQSESGIEGKSPTRRKARKYQLPDFEEREECLSSDLSMELNLSETPLCSSTLMDDDKEEDEELPSILLQQGPLSVEPGMLVWCKFQKYPYWPAVVRNVMRKRKKASILFIEESLSDPSNKKKSLSVGLRTLKNFDCEEKQDLTNKAKENYSTAINWCIDLIQDYRIRVGCGSFAGSFIEYCTADISYPVRKEAHKSPFQIIFPVLENEEESQPDTIPTKQQLSKKVLPDRARAARDKANEKLVDYIVKNNKVEKHLLAIMKGKKKSRWLQDFLNSNQCLTCIETYLEDEGQCEMVVAYLKSVCDQMSSNLEKLKNGDRTRFTLDVLLPEAVICAISAVDKISYKKAEEKFMKGPSVSKREREVFEKKILEEKKSRESLKMEADPGAIKDEH